MVLLATKKSQTCAEPTAVVKYVTARRLGLGMVTGPKLSQWTPISSADAEMVACHLKLK